MARGFFMISSFDDQILQSLHQINRFIFLLLVFIFGDFAFAKETNMKLNQITVPTVDMKRSVDFYQKLGFHLIVDSIPRYARFICPDGDATFSLHRVDQLANGPGVVIYFETDRLDELVADLKKENVDFEHGPIDQAWLWHEARLKDPDGNEIILYHAGDNRKNPPWRIN